MLYQLSYSRNESPHPSSGGLSLTFVLSVAVFRQPTELLVLVDLCNLTGTYGATTLADSETQTLVQSNGVDQLNSNLHVVTRHHHLNAFGQRNLTRAVHGAEVELRTILVAERSVTTTLFLLQDVDRSLELLEGLDLSGMAEHHTTLDLDR